MLNPLTWLPFGTRSDILSPELRKIWKGLPPSAKATHANKDFVIYIRGRGFGYRTSTSWDAENPKDPTKFNQVQNRVATILAADASELDDYSWHNVIQQVVAAQYQALKQDYENATAMLDKAEEYLKAALGSVQRKRSIAEQLTARKEWRSLFSRWSIVHYAIGVSAILCSSLVAAKPMLLGWSEHGFGFTAWVAAFLTALLTFLVPEKKADKYRRAWSVLNNEISRYIGDETYSLKNVSQAYREGEAIILDSERSRSMRSRVT